MARGSRSRPWGVVEGTAVSTDAPRGTKRYEPLDTDGDSPGNDGKRRLEAVRRVGELGTSACSQLRIDEDELWSQLFHHNE